MDGSFTIGLYKYIDLEFGSIHRFCSHQNRGMLLPADLNDLMAANYPVSVFKGVLEQVDITELLPFVRSTDIHRQMFT